MSDTPNIDHVLKHARNLVSLLEDPHPGLFTWAQAYGENMKALSDFWNEPEPGPRDIKEVDRIMAKTRPSDT